LADLEKCCGPPVLTLALSSTVIPVNTVTGLLTVDVRPNKSQQPKRYTNPSPVPVSQSTSQSTSQPVNQSGSQLASQPVSQSTNGQDQTSGDVDKRHPPPFPASYYVLSPAEMADNNYPLPVVNPDGTLSLPDDEYVATQPPTETGNHLSLVAVDCEMCYTCLGLELTRVTFLDAECKVLYDSLVLPARTIVDYNTQYSGITGYMMANVTTSLQDVQAWVLEHISAETLLVGEANQAFYYA
jgi:RNA exonuclease 1